MQGSNPPAHSWAVLAVAGLNVLGAGAGAFGLATGWLALSRTAEARLPWGSTVFSGVALAYIRELSFFHPLYVGVGLLLVWLGAREVRARPVMPPP